MGSSQLMVEQTARGGDTTCEFNFPVFLEIQILT